MSSIQQQIEKMEAIERRLNGGASSVVTLAGADMAADIANRVIDKGENSEGSKFSAYSTKAVPAYFYYGRSRNAGGEAKVRAANKKKQGVSYNDFRQFNGLGTLKNFSFTNELWRGFNQKGVKYSGGVYVLTLGGTTAASAEKIGWMNAQEGRSITAPNREEVNRTIKKLVAFVING